MPKLVPWIAFVPLVLVAQGCTFSASERCGNGFEWKDHTCVKVYATEDGGDSEDGDASSGNSEGLGEPCETMGPEDCSQYDNMYCAVNPTNPDGGYCTTQNCTPGGKDCPQGYACCKAHPVVPYLCLTQADFDALGGTCPG